MRFTESLELAVQHAESALSQMADQGIPANPQNFTVWYAYYARWNPDLVKALDAMLGDKVEFSAERNHEIYGKYFEFDAESGQLGGASQRLQEAISEVMNHIAKAGRDQSAYGEKLTGFSGKLTAGANDGELGELVRGILSETQQIIEKNQHLESSLSESNQQIIELHQSLEDVRREVMTDALTGLANRKCFDATLADIADQVMETGGRLSLLLIDIDHFKVFNDTYGHLVGDEALKVVARLLKDSVKGRDIPVRYGGEEFAVILPQTSLQDGVTVAEQIRRALASRELQNKKTGEKYGRITLSIGVAQYRDGEPLDELIKRADDVLYFAKGCGRNKVAAETALSAAVKFAG